MPLHNNNLNPLYKGATGLLLPGGGVQTIFQVGVLKGLGILANTFKAINGASAGIGLAAPYIAGQLDDAAIVWIERLTKFRTLNLLWALPGLELFRKAIDIDYLVDECIKPDLKFDQVFNKEIDIIASLFNPATGYTEQHLATPENYWEILKATIAIPRITRKAFVNGVQYNDGGIANRHSLKWMLNQGFKKILLIDNIPFGSKLPRLGRLTTAFLYPNSPNSHLAREAVQLRAKNEEDNWALIRANSDYVLFIGPDQVVPANMATRSKNKTKSTYFMGIEIGKKISTDVHLFLDIDPSH